MKMKKKQNTNKKLGMFVYIPNFFIIDIKLYFFTVT